MSIESVAVSDVTVRNMKTAEENQTIQVIAKIMNCSNIGSVVIDK